MSTTQAMKSAEEWADELTVAACGWQVNTAIIDTIRAVQRDAIQAAARVAESHVDYKGKPKPNTLAIAAGIRALSPLTPPAARECEE